MVDMIYAYQKMCNACAKPWDVCRLRKSSSLTFFMIFRKRSSRNKLFQFHNRTWHRYVTWMTFPNQYMNERLFMHVHTVFKESNPVNTWFARDVIMFLNPKLKNHQSYYPHQA